ncbi:hypothetical protein RFI_12166 [Reticulomyxa filosa]|uniref:Caspase family p20 domain-containing protein n=1 Tax=Reticulomyxa filosa TaxID=46433 RepID=X6NGY7_RETFI|nr:hypothetical protein RFI_12166 [Reticulomyxa filosa]|eukprot:ETO24979.1 hypothetical protein RFI_12166 [Reticulomyxa filosa]
MGERKNLIKMKELTFGELLRQSHNCLEEKHLQKMRTENLRLELVNMKNDIIEFDEDVKREFESGGPLFEINLVPFQPSIIIGKKKKIKNVLVIMIGISEYIDNERWPNLSGVKEDDTENFKQLFEQELNYTFVCNSSPKMTKENIQNFMNQVIIDHGLRNNTNKYDGLIMIFCGYGGRGDEGDVLVTSDGKYIPIAKFQDSFDCERMQSFEDFPKIFIIDVCHTKIAEPQKSAIRGIRGLRNYDGFLVIWSTTKGNTVGKLSLLSQCMKNIVTSTYKSGYSFNQMLQDIMTEICNKNEWHCVESKNAIDYYIVFQQRKSV